MLKAPLIGHNEKRRHKRRSATWLMKYRFQDGKIITSKSIDVSVSGISFKTQRLMPNNTRALVQVYSMIHGVEYTFDAVVEAKHSSLSNNEFHCGSQFVKLSELAKKLISIYVTNHSPSQELTNKVKALSKT